ncbi:MAG: hypothetical protein R2707_20910 [Acidimicrobiales bacterium]
MIESTLDVAGIAVRVRAEDRSYADCALSRLGTEKSDAEPEIDLVLDSRAPEVAAGARRQEMDGFLGWEDDDSLWIGLRDSRAVVRGTAVHVGGAIDGESPLDLFDDLLQFAIAVAVARPDRLMMHAAVVALGDEALLLVGPSGRGKSTLSAAALVGGWDLLGDDLAVIDAGAMSARGVARRPMVPASVATAHGLTGEMEDGPRQRLRLPASTLTTGSRRLVGIVTVDHGTEGHVEDLGRGDLSVLDDGYAAPPFRQALRRQLAASASLVALPAVRLAHARDESTRIARAQDLLLDALGRCRAGDQ